MKYRLVSFYFVLASLLTQRVFSLIMKIFNKFLFEEQLKCKKLDRPLYDLNRVQNLILLHHILSNATTVQYGYIKENILVEIFNGGNVPKIFHSIIFNRKYVCNSGLRFLICGYKCFRFRLSFRGNSYHLKFVQGTFEFILFRNKTALIS